MKCEICGSSLKEMQEICNICEDCLCKELGEQGKELAGLGKILCIGQGNGIRGQIEALLEWTSTDFSTSPQEVRRSPQEVRKGEKK